MRDIWYGDRRDRVKWGALVHLARSQGLSKIVQVAFFQQLPNPTLQTDRGTVPVPQEVWDHFSNLRNIEKLGELTGIEIVVFDQLFSTSERRRYVERVTQGLDQHSERPKIVFLDPDTGIEPAKATAAHVTIEDIGEFWNALNPRDWLAVYQHAARTAGWLETRREQLRQACNAKHIRTFQSPEIAKDVAVLALEKPRLGSSATSPRNDP